MSVSLKSGGLTATVQGSGSVDGTINLGAGAQATMSLAVMYTTIGGLAYPSTYLPNYATPYVNGDFTAANLSVAVTVQVKMDFTLSVGCKWWSICQWKWPFAEEVIIFIALYSMHVHCGIFIMEFSSSVNSMLGQYLVPILP